jgi:hypothetical protein
MKGTEHFKKTIAEYLNQRAATDPLFAPNLAKEGKNIEDCITYILNQVKASGCNGFSDDEIYSMAVHYYDEDDTEVGKAIKCRVVVNHTIELTEKEKAEARQEAINKYQAELISKLQETKRSKTKESTDSEQIPQPSLFDVAYETGK